MFDITRAVTEHSLLSTREENDSSGRMRKNIQGPHVVSWPQVFVLARKGSADAPRPSTPADSSAPGCTAQRHRTGRDGRDPPALRSRPRLSTALLLPLHTSSESHRAAALTSGA